MITYFVKDSHSSSTQVLQTEEPIVLQTNKGDKAFVSFMNNGICVKIGNTEKLIYIDLDSGEVHIDI